MTSEDRRSILVNLSSILVMSVVNSGHHIFHAASRIS